VPLAHAPFALQALVFVASAHRFWLPIGFLLLFGAARI
jgi:hypothetical protein